jgi:hypothetical protein
LTCPVDNKICNNKLLEVLMEFDLAVLGVVIGFMVLANRLVEMLITPLFDKYGWDKFWLMYPSWILSGVFVWLSGVNLFTAYIPDVLIGKILTAVVAGGGSNLLHDLVDRPAEIWVPLEGDNVEAKGNGWG